MRLCILLFLTALVAGMTPAADVFPFRVVEKRLPNGFSVLAVPMDTPGIISFYTVVRTGSRNEPERGKTGFAHFFEHMMFRGTEKYPEAAYNAVLKRMGADSNAYTSDDETVYHMTGAADSLETMMEIESDRFMNLKYSEADFKKEAGAVLGEYRKSHSSPFLTLFETIQGTAYTTHTYRHTTMGFYEDILDMPNQYAHSLDFFSRYYRPENCVLIITGDVEPEQAFRAAEKYYGSWRKGYDPKPIPVEPPQKGERSRKIDWNLPSRPYLVITYHAPAFEASNRKGAALDAISELLFASNAPLYQELVVEKQWCEMLTGWNGNNRDPGLFYVMARLKDVAMMEKTEKRIEEALQSLASKRISRNRLQDVKSHIRYRFAGGLTTPEAVAKKLTRFVVATGDWRSVNHYYATIASLTTRDVRDAAQAVFRPDNRTIVTLVSRSGS